MNLNGYIKSYTEYAEYIDLSANSIHTYIENVTKFFNAVNKNVEDIKKADVNMYLMKYKDGHAYSTLEIMVRSLNSFYNIILDELQLIDMVNPVVGIKLPKRKEEQEHHMVLVKDEVMVLIHNAKNIREKAMLMFMFNTGVRFCEISNVTLDMYLNRDSNNAIDLVITKGMKPRTVYLSENTCKVIDKYISDMRKDGCEYLFVSNQGTKMDKQSCSRTWKCLAKRAGFDDEKIAKLSNHCLRASYASYCLNDLEVPILAVASSMGHKKPDVTLEHYYKADSEKIEGFMMKVC